MAGPKFVIKGPRYSIVCERLSTRIGRRRIILRRLGREAVKAFRGSTPYETGIRKRRAPDGTPYAPLQRSTLEVRQKRGIKRKGAFILRETGTHIVDAMAILEVGTDHVRVGVAGAKNKKITSIQHAGFTTASNSMIPGKKVPARKIFGMSKQLAKTINTILAAYIGGGIQSARR